MTECQKLWVVVKTDNRPGFLGGAEELAIEHLQKTGFETYWMHYRTTTFPHPRNGRKSEVVTRGYFRPWMFVAIEPRPNTVAGIRSIADDVAAIKDTRYVADVLWSETDRYYLPQRWLTWVKTVRIDPETGIVEEPVPNDPDSGLFEAPSDIVVQGRKRSTYKPRDHVKIVSGSPFAGFLAEVKRISGDAVTAELEVDIFGRRVNLTLDSSQLERAT